MKKMTLCKNIISALVVSIVFCVCGFSQDDVAAVYDNGFSERMRSPVPFLHDAHNDAAQIDECNVCHHVYEEGEINEDESSEDMECSECHTINVGGSSMELTRMYHLRCKGCHMEKGAGPVMCSECHRK